MSKEIQKFPDTGNSKLDEIFKRRGVNLDKAKDLLEQEQKEDQRKAEESKKVNIMGLVDATGSMTHVWNETKKVITELIQNMSQYGDIEMKWVAYRDYDAGNRLLEWSEWTKDPHTLISFFNRIECRWGDDWEEAVEAGLKYAREDQRKKTVFLIGDASPHANGEWRLESKLLAEENIKVYSFIVDSHSDMTSDTVKTFSKISKITGGTWCLLKSVEDIFAVLSMIISKQVSNESLKLTLIELKEKSGGKLPPHLDDFSNRLLLGE